MIQGYNSSLTMLGGSSQNNQISQEKVKKNDESSDIAQNDLDDEIPF